LYFPAFVVGGFPPLRSWYAAMSQRLFSLRLATRRARQLYAALAFAIVCGHFATVPSALAWSPFGEAPPPGTPQWWKEHKKDRVLDVEKGYSVQGEQGYFDGDGRPMQGPAATERVVDLGDSDEETGLMPGLDPRVQYGKMKSAVGLGPNEQFARDQVPPAWNSKDPV
jgi:hypothetical protein